MAEIDDTQDTDIHDSVKEFYGEYLKTQADIQTGVNCLKKGPQLAAHVQDAFALVHDHVTMRYFGCGPVIPEALEGCHVLDLGSGSGRDCFALSKLIGPSGHVVGIDMTEEQLAFAKGFLEYHREKFGYAQTNIDFRFGYIEKLGDAGIKDNSFDLIISNCVICLCPNKRAVLREAYRVLKEGGEMYFSDMYTDSVVSEEVKNDPVMWGEGIGGAQKWQDLYTLTAALGFSQPRVVTASKVNTSKFKDKLDGAKFVSVTYRFFKLPKDLKPLSYATYLGEMEGCADEFTLDHATVFKKEEKMIVNAELATVLASSRFNRYFSLEPVEFAHTSDPKVDPVKLAEAGKSCTDICQVDI